MKILIVFLGISFLLLSCGGKRVEEKQEEVSLSDQKSLAVASLLRSNYKQAIEDIGKAEAINPNDPEVFLIKGLIYYGLKDYKSAEQFYKKAIELKTDYSEARYDLCMLYLKIDSLDSAIEQCDRASSDLVYRSRDKALTSLGVAYFRKGNIDKAREYYQKSLELNPALFYTHNEVGKLYMAIGKEQEAIDEFKKAVEANNIFDEAHYNLGLAYLKVGRTADACESFKKAAELSPDSVSGVNAKSYISSLCNNR